MERSPVLQLPPHPNRPTRSFRVQAENARNPLAIDLFAGCGGLGLGLEKAGYAVILATDTDPQARETYRHNLPARVPEFDLSDPQRIDRLVRHLEGLPIQLVAGGPPCQPFSRAGRPKIRSLVKAGTREARDERAELWESFLGIVERLMPVAVLLENVPDMALGDDLIVLRAMTERLERIGFDVEARLLDAWRFGVPQHRQRLILLARRDGRPIEWPVSQRRITLREAIGDLPPLGTGTGDPEMKARPPKTPFQKKARAQMNGHAVVWDHHTRAVREDDREAFRLMKPGTRYSELPKRLRRYRADIFDDKYNKLAWDDLCRSITAHIAKDGYWYIHPSEPRTLTVREAARVQTFPDNFRFAGSRTHAFRQIGNAVPPALAEVVGRQLLRGSRKAALPPARRPSEQKRRIRRRMLEWASVDAEVAPWRHPCEPWVALCGVLLGDRYGAEAAAVAEFLGVFPEAAAGVAPRIRSRARELDTPDRKAHLRLAAAAAALARTRRPSPEILANAASLGPQEEALLRLLGFGGDGIVATTAALRVTARLGGTRVDEKNKLSDGRMALAALVGIEDGPPRLNAAFHALGRSVCRSTDPECSRCPLRTHCRTACGRRKR